MLAKVTSLEERAWDLMQDLHNVMPERYMERDERMRDDPIWIAWYLSADGVDTAYVFLKELRSLLKQKVQGKKEADSLEQATT